VGRAREPKPPRAVTNSYDRDFALERVPERERDVRRDRVVPSLSSAFLPLKKR
jgi:hypothetical protein